MFSKIYSDTTLSIALTVSAAAWGLYWFPLRTIENIGITGSWSVVILNSCPLLILIPLLLLNIKNFKGLFVPTIFTSIMIGLAATLYSNSLVETTVVRGTLLFYLTPIWSTIIGVLWLSEKLTKVRIVSIALGFLGLLLLLSNGSNSEYPINIGDLFGLLSGIFWSIGASSLNKWPKIPNIPLASLIFTFATAFSLIFAIFFYSDPSPSFLMLNKALPTASFWSICILLPSFYIIFSVSKYLFPGRVGILMMSEVVVAIISAAILIPEETMNSLQWFGAIAIISAGVFEVLYGYNKETLKNISVKK